MSRVVVGLALVGAALWWRDPTWADVAVGLVAMPAAATVVLGLRATTGLVAAPVLETASLLTPALGKF